MAGLKYRLISAGSVLLALPIALVLSPVLFVVAIISDLVSGLLRFPTVRLVFFGFIYLAHQWQALLAGLALWLSGGFGRNLDLAKHREFQSWWIGSLLDWAGKTINLELDLSDLDELPDGDLILMSRHASLVDAGLPIHLVVGQNSRPVHYVLKREMQWDAAICLFGHRLNNHFVDRGGNTESELAVMRQMADESSEDAALVIFPEGTYATPASRAKVAASLERKGLTEEAERARSLRHLLPPMPGGILTLLEAKPDAHIVILGHVGLESAAKLSGLRKVLPLTQAVRMKWWVIRREDVPTEREEIVNWLNAQWADLDQWIVEHSATANTATS